MRGSLILLLLLPTVLSSTTVVTQEVRRLDRATRNKLSTVMVAVSVAQQAQDKVEVYRQMQLAVALLGDRAGVPETADEFLPVPADALSLTKAELPVAAAACHRYIKRQKWWHVGLDPTKTNHALREVANIMEACIAAQKVNGADSEMFLTIARDAGDFLIWTQQQAETGLLPFPAVRNGTGRPFEVAEAFYRRAEENGTLSQIIRNGWSVDDFADGGLQFDNGLAGVALVRLFEVTGEQRYKQAAIKSADWAISRPVVTNWNYNSFSVFLLSETFRLTGDEKYVAAARQKTLLGILPGQLTEGPRRGRWADPHNARPAYHYIMVRGLAALAAVLPADDADLPKITEGLRLALSARNPDYQQGIFNADSSVEALLLVKSLPPHVAVSLTDCRTEEALQILERYAADQYRTGKPALSPGPWMQLLAFSSYQPGVLNSNPATKHSANSEGRK